MDAWISSTSSVNKQTNKQPTGGLRGFCQVSTSSQDASVLTWEVLLLLFDTRTTTAGSGASIPHRVKTVRDWSVRVFHTHAGGRGHTLRPAAETRRRLQSDRWAQCVADVCFTGDQKVTKPNDENFSSDREQLEQENPLYMKSMLALSLGLWLNGWTLFVFVLLHFNFFSGIWEPHQWWRDWMFWLLLLLWQILAFNFSHISPEDTFWLLPFLCTTAAVKVNLIARRWLQPRPRNNLKF